MTPAAADHLITAARSIEQPHRVAAEVLHGVPQPRAASSQYRPSASAWAYATGGAMAAVALALLGLWWQRVAARLRAVLQGRRIT